MNIPSGLRIFPALFFASQSIQPSLAATSQYWNPGGAGGDGIWGTTPGDKNWNTSPGAPAGNTFWQDGVDDVAVFQDATGGIVTVFDPVQTTGIIQDGADYTINASTITLSPDSTASVPFIQVDGKGARLTIDSILDGSSGLTKNGSGGLVLTGDNLYSGTTVVADGTLILEGSLTSNVINISNASGLWNQSGGLPDDTILTNAGVLTIAGVSETITSYTSNSGILQSFDGKTLFTTATVLNGDSKITSSLHADTFASNGTSWISQSGSVTAGTSRIDSGVLTLAGTLSTPSLTIAPGGSLIDSATGSLNDDMILTNSGDLQVVGQRETIGTYRSNDGTLMASSGTLVASDAELNNGSLVAGNLETTRLNSSGSVEISGQVIADSARIRGGTLTLSSGQLTSPDIEIDGRGHLINQSGGLADSTVLTNNGRLTMEVDDTVTRYLSNNGELTDGAGTLFADITELTGDAFIDGNLNTGSLDISDTGRGAMISGTVVTNLAVVSSGKLDLPGQLISPILDIASGARVSVRDDGLSSNMALTNAGTLSIRTQDTISAYLSNGGRLSSYVNYEGTLVTTTAELNNGSLVESNLTTQSLVSNGAVETSGTTTANTIEIASGQLTNTGILGTLTSHVNIRGGAALVASGTQRYDLLTSSGPTSGHWIGDLINPTNIAPGGQSGIGSLAVTGNFANTSTANLHFEVGGMRNDHIMVSGNAHFDGALDLTQRGNPTFSPLSPINLVSASSYSGNITSLTENLDGAVWFNPGNGNLNLLGNLAGPNGALAGASAEQTSTWLALYDDVIDPGTRNVINIPGFNPGYNLTSGIADASNPDLLWALDASFTPGGLNRQLLNHLSPAPYAGLADYAVQANRSHQRSALTAPALAAPPAKVHTNAKSSAKDAILASQAPAWELFAATDYFTVDSGSSINAADYTLSSWGFLVGARIAPRNGLKIAAYLALDEGSVQGSLIDADSTGWSLGLIGDLIINEASQTRLTAGMSYGSYGFDGRRTSASATNAGWAPGLVGFSDADSDAFEIFATMEGRLYQTERFRLTPSVGLHFTSGSVDSFSEFTATGPGSPIALQVGSNNHQSGLAEFSLLAEADITSQLLVQGNIGINARLGDDGYTLNARFTSGGRPIYAGVDGLSSSSVFLGLGAVYQVNQDLSAGIFYRAEFRDEAHTQQGFSLSSSLRF